MGVRKVPLHFRCACCSVVCGCRRPRPSVGIEFVGGTSIAFHNTGDTSIEDMRAAFAEAGEPDAVVQTTNSDGSDGFPGSHHHHVSLNRRNHSSESGRYAQPEHR